MSDEERARAVAYNVGVFVPSSLAWAEACFMPASLRTARAEEREACAKLVEQYSFSKPFLHPDIAWDDMNENARMVCHMTCQTLAYDIPRPQGQWGRL